MTNFLDRLMGRQPARKAVYGGPWLTAYQQGSPLTSLSSDPKERMAKYLAAYRVGWFYKAGSKISRDLGGLDVSLSYEDSEGDNEADITAPANNLPFEALSPTEQLLRLMERPNERQTGRQLRAKTQIRLDFAGAAFWYLENGDRGLPSAIYGINPCRMDPSLDKAGNLIGWVMDRTEGNPGIPFTTDEIILFSTSTANDDWYGVSVVEAVYTQVPLTDMIARHTADVLTTGGRLAGMMWPKDRALDETEFQEAARAWRNVASDPNAARRLLLFPEPMEYAAGAATPKDIGIPELAALNREEITTAFPVNPYMLGLPLQPGMNSGESLRYVTRDYWANTIHDRAELFEETLQIHLVPRYEAATGRPLDLDLEQPDLDNAVEVIEKTGALQALVALGFDPKDAIRNVGLDHIAWLGLPKQADPNVVAGAGATTAAASGGPDVLTNDSSRRDTVSVQQTLAKAVKSRRTEVVGEVLPGFVPTMEAFLADQRERLVANVERELTGLTKAQRKALPAEGWWDPGLEDRLLGESLDSLYVTLSRSALTVVANDVGRVVTRDNIKRVTEQMLRNAATRITDINETTRQAARETLAIGVQRGYTLGQIINGFPAEGFEGLRSLVNPKTGKAMFDAYRAELVARTETMRAYNESALLGYKEYRVTDVIASDGDKDEPCARRDGRTFSVEEAMDEFDHPNGTLDWVPVVPDRKAVDVEPSPVDRYAELAMKAIEAMSRPEQPPAAVNVTVPQPEIHVSQPAIHLEVPAAVSLDMGPVAEAISNLTDAQKSMAHDIAEMKANPLPAPIVNVKAPIVHPTPVTVNVDNVRVTAMPDRAHRIQRDKAGKPTGSIEADI